MRFSCVSLLRPCVRAVEVPFFGCGILIATIAAGPISTAAAQNSAAPAAATTTVTVADVPMISTREIVGIVPGFPFLYAIQASNSPTTYAATDLPRGLTCDSATGIISGVTAEQGTFHVTLAATNTGGTAVATQEMVADGLTPIELPMVRNATPPAAGLYRAGDVLTIVIEIDAPYGGVQVIGTPRIALSIGGTTRYANYRSMDDTRLDRPRLDFSYVVGTDEAGPAGVTVGTSIEQNGGSIRDRMGLYCALGLPEVETSGVRVAKVTPSRSDAGL